MKRFWAFDLLGGAQKRWDSAVFALSYLRARTSLAPYEFAAGCVVGRAVWPDQASQTAHPTIPSKVHHTAFERYHLLRKPLELLN